MATGADKKVTLKALGLYTYPNKLQSPEGAMEVALDVFVDRPGMVQNRPPHAPITYTGTTAFNQPFQPSPYSPVYASGISSLLPDGVGILGYQQIPANNLQFPTAALATAMVNTGATAGLITSMFRASGNDYIQSGGEDPSNHPYTACKTFRWSPTAATGRTVGMPTCPTPADYIGNPTFGGAGGTAPKYGLPLTGQPAFGVAASTPLATATGGGTAYRTLLLTKDSQGNLVRGPPSGRLVLASAVAYTYGLVQPIPTNVIAGDIWQVYRSEIQSDSAVQPSDDCRLVYEYILQAADITRKYVTLPGDVAPDSLRGPALYTNDTQQGALQAERCPPDCQLAAAHKDVVFYGGVTSKGASAVLTVVGLSGWAVGSTFTFSGLTFTAVAPGTGENWPSRQFVLSTSTSPSIAVADTLRSLTRCMAYAIPSFSFTFISSASSTTFQMLIQQGAQGGTAGAALTYTGIPANTISPAGSIALAYYGKSNWLYFSKSQQPEAVPDVNYVPIGADSVPIRGLASLRDSLFVFKEDGLYRVTGTNAANIRVELFDLTVRMYAGQDRSIAIAGNQVFALTSQGVVTVTESGVSVIDLAVKDITSQYATKAHYFTDFNQDGNLLLWPAVGGASENGHKYVLVFTNTSAASNSQTCYAYNFINNAWTQITLPGTAGYCTGVAGITRISDKSDFLVFSTGNSSAINYLSTAASYIGIGGTSWGYGIESEVPGEMVRYYDVAVGMPGSSGVTSLTFLFSSDSGAAPVSVTQAVPSGNYSVKVGVPKDHAYCSQLYFTITGSAGDCSLLVSSVVVGYSYASDRIPSGGRS